MKREMLLKAYAEETARPFGRLRVMRLPGFLRRTREGKIYDADALDDAADNAAHGFNRTYQIETETELREINRRFLVLLHHEQLAAIRAQKEMAQRGMTLDHSKTMTGRQIPINGEPYG